MIFACNALMWNLFVKSMDCTTSVHAVVVNNAANFFLTAIFALVLFGEPLSLQWAFGAVLILTGVVLMNYGQQKKEARD